jgi:pimeloyl-ACP methyl ester carboxylesterase
MHMVTSRDGTKIAYTKEGSGPSIVLVGGALDDGSENATLIPALAERFTVINDARRGRDGSGDRPPHSLPREIEDLTAVVSSAGGSAHLFGASSGGALALEAAASGVSALSIAVYDVPYSVTSEAVSAWQTYVAQLRAALAEDDRHQAIELFMGVAGLPQEAIAEAKSSAVLGASVADRPHTRLRRCVPERRVAAPGSAVLDQPAGAADHQGRADRSDV